MKEELKKLIKKAEPKFEFCNLPSMTKQNEFIKSKTMFGDRIILDFYIRKGIEIGIQEFKKRLNKEINKMKN